MSGEIDEAPADPIGDVPVPELPRRKHWSVVECTFCNRPLFFPVEWNVREHICLRCRRGQP